MRAEHFFLIQICSNAAETDAEKDNMDLNKRGRIRESGKMREEKYLPMLVYSPQHLA